jgi:hypothetical protein
MNYKISFLTVRRWSGCTLLVGATFFPHSAQALGTIGFDSSSFMYQSSTRGTSATSVNATIEGASDSSIFHVQGDAEIDTYVTDNPTTGYNVKQAFISTQKDLLPNQEISVGRRYYEWSKVDHEWSSVMSLWSPRYTWDQIHPETVGMTGAFYEFKTQHVQFLAFGSPVAIPEMGAPTSDVNHQLVSSDPLFAAPPSHLPIMGVDTPIVYNLDTPPLQDILFRPNFALRFRYDFDSGFWASANSGVLPVNIVQLAAAPQLDGATGNLDVNIIPQFPMRNINTVETGFDSKDKSWDLWLSASYEQPFQFQNEQSWLNPAITNTSIFSSGTDIALTSNFTFNGSVLFVNEAPFNHAGDLPDVDISLPTRFPLKQGIKVGGDLRFSDYTNANVAWIQDLIEQTHFVSLDVKHQFRHSTVQVGAGADLFFTDTTAGWVGQYYGDDRIRGWLKYAF